MPPTKRAQLTASIVLVLTALMLVGLAGRVMWLQKHVGPEEIRKLRSQHTASITVMPTRGDLRLADDTRVASSVRMYNLFADPSFIADPSGKTIEVWKLRQERAALPPGDPRIAQIDAKIARCRSLTMDAAEQARAAKETLLEALSPLVEIPAAELQFELEWNATYDNGKPRRFLWLKKEVDEAFHQRFLKLKSELREQARAAAKARDPDRAQVLARALDGVGFVKSVKRVYPMGSLAGQIIGTTNVDGGMEGMEFQFEHMLRGRPGKMLVIKDAARHTLMVEDDMFEPVDDGRTVWLTIDTVIQSIAQEELEKTCRDFNAESGCAIVMDPHTGKVLAMASWPHFDPAKFHEARPEDRRNRNITDPYEPGSIWKPFVLAWALEKGVVKPTDIIDCGGGTWYDPTGRAVKDVHGVGVVTVAEVLQKSSNVGMTKIGWKMGIPTLHEGVRVFGFGSRTGIELPGDQRGLVKPLSQWNRGTLTSASFGYEVAATPLQLVRGYAPFANGGWLVTPRVVHAAEDRPGHAVPWQELAGPPVEKQILSKKTADTMRDIMEGVYIKGTAKGKGSQLYRLFGKTGTAHLAVRGGGHYAGDQYNSSFLIGGPVSKPQLVGIVAIHRPDRSRGHFGGTVAAPPATRLIERSLVYMHVPPDQPAFAGRSFAGQ